MAALRSVNPTKFSCTLPSWTKRKTIESCSFDDFSSDATSSMIATKEAELIYFFR